MVNIFKIFWYMSNINRLGVIGFVNFLLGVNFNKEMKL